MSWILGIVGRDKFPVHKFISENKLLFKYESEELNIYAGGFADTLFYQQAEAQTGCITGGVGFTKKNDSYKFLSNVDWDKLHSSFEKRNEINGHFVSVQWNGSHLKFLNDIYGVRDLFFINIGETLLFTTRLDFLNYFIKKHELDLTEFASNWLLSIPFSHNSLLKNVKRLGPGGYAEWAQNKLEIKNYLWNPVPQKYSTADFSETLKNILTFPLKDDKRLSLGLSGGLDSRVMLDYLLNSRNNNWQVHSFGKVDHPDMILSKKIADDNKLNHFYIDSDKFVYEDYVTVLKEYVGQLGLIFPASKILMFPIHKYISEKGFIILDGAMGEIHRGELLRRLLYFGKKAFLKKDIDKLFNLFYSDKGVFIKDEILNEMKLNMHSLISDIYSKMPDVHHTEYEKWLELLIMIYKLPHIASSSQAVLDSFSIAYMPYIQTDLMNISFNLNSQEKKNGKMYRKILNESANNLNNYYLVKNTITYPYNTSTFSSRIIFAYKNRSKATYKDKSAEIFLMSMKEFIYDTTDSISFTNYELYDHKKIKGVVNEFYDGNKKHADYLNWWLTFEIWRQIFLEKD